MSEITNPESGIKINTKIESFGLIINIDTIVNTIVRGSLTISSKIDRNECCISKTSDEILDIVSPFLFSE